MCHHAAIQTPCISSITPLRVIFSTLASEYEYPDKTFSRGLILRAEQ